MNIMEYIKPELLILVPVMYLIGVGLKKSKMKDKYIPLCLGSIAVLLSVLWILSTQNVIEGKEIFAAIFTAVTQGVLTAGASVYISQLKIQSKKEE